MASLTLPCRVASSFTAIGGVLDTANYIVCLMVRPSEDTLAAFAALRVAFLWHMTYIYCYLLMVYLVAPLDGSTATVAAMRAYGVVANSFAIYWTAVAIDAWARGSRAEAAPRACTSAGVGAR